MASGTGLGMTAVAENPRSPPDKGQTRPGHDSGRPSLEILSHQGGKGLIPEPSLAQSSKISANTHILEQGGSHSDKSATGASTNHSVAHLDSSGRASRSPLRRRCFVKKMSPFIDELDINLVMSTLIPRAGGSESLDIGSYNIQRTKQLSIVARIAAEYDVFFIQEFEATKKRTEAMEDFARRAGRRFFTSPSRNGKVNLTGIFVNPKTITVLGMHELHGEAITSSTPQTLG